MKTKTTVNLVMKMMTGTTTMIGTTTNVMKWWKN